MRIFACGDSFTHGEELLDPVNSSWPALLAKKLDATITNTAISSGTNARTVYQTIKHLQDGYDLYLIAWTGYARFTFYRSDNNHDVSFIPQLSFEHGYSSDPSYRKWGETLYKYWYNELYAFKLWLQQIIQLQKVLGNNPYLMINTFDLELENWLAPRDKFTSAVKHLINLDVMNDKQIIDEYNEIQYYISLIDFSKFYHWGEFYIAQLGATHKQGKNGHFLEDGHKHLAELLYTHVQNKTSYS